MQPLGADNNQLRWIVQQSERLMPPEGQGWELVRSQPLVLPGPNGQIGIAVWTLWARDKDADHERH